MEIIVPSTLHRDILPVSHIQVALQTGTEVGSHWIGEWVGPGAGVNAVHERASVSVGNRIQILLSSIQQPGHETDSVNLDDI
jgi:hypothetical protein